MNPSSALLPIDLPFEALARGLGDALRWEILRELAAGEPLMVVELAQRLGRPPTTISKHLAVLRASGLVVLERRRHRIPPRFLSGDPAQRTLDLGAFVLRLAGRN